MTDKHTAQLFITCLIDSLFPDVGESVLDVLEARGIQVEFPTDQTCCGQPAYNAGFRDEARATALRFLDVFEADLATPIELPVGTPVELPIGMAVELPSLPAASGHIVCPSGSCTAMIKHGYTELFKDDPALLARARALAARTYEFTEYLVDVVGDGGRNAGSDERAGRDDRSGRLYGGTITYHPSCHLLRGLKIDRQPRQLLAELKEVTLIELPDAHECCGFGGLFAVKHGDVSGEILEKKLAAIRKTGAHSLVGCDMSCLMHIQGGLRRRGDPVRCLHIAQLLS